ncbi:MAG: CinA family protein [Gammaproteobacteria bacterium]
MLSNNTSVNNLIEKLAERLQEKKLMLAVAESCTGGLLAQQCTELCGSSSWFECGFVTYSNASKIRLLDVQVDVLNENGAVSSQVADQMAEGVLSHSDADISASITGIAGPSGGSDTKPVGTVYISTAVKNQSAGATHHIFQGNRQSIREQSMQMAITKLISKLEHI